MKIAKCDRCGKIIEIKPQKAGSITKMLGDLSKSITEAFHVMTGVTIYRIYADREPADLCETCQKSFEVWMRYGQRKAKVRKPQNEAKPAVEEINIRTNAAGIAEENIPKFGD